MATKRPAEDDSIPDQPQEKVPKVDEEDQGQGQDGDPEDEVEVEKNGTLESTAPDIVVEEPTDDPPNEDNDEEEEEKQKPEEEEEANPEESEGAPDLPDDFKEDADFKGQKLPEEISQDGEGAEEEAENES